jgi:hypothetical protein
MKTSELIAIARNCNNSNLLLLILDTGKICSINELIEFGGFEGCYWRVWDKLCDLLVPLLKNKSEKYLIQLCNTLQWRWKNSFFIMVLKLGVIKDDESWILSTRKIVDDDKLWISYLDTLIPLLDTKTFRELIELTEYIPTKFSKPIWKSILNSGQEKNEARLFNVGQQLDNTQDWITIIQTGLIKDTHLLLKVAARLNN